ncbi:MAG TPA: BTAD domain-containing putative transcriptional regulator [Longimicrobiales bacterium]|nr:BTAD domain-containing putative transcriptional regulator [Longimicrobiales bacterium]
MYTLRLLGNASIEESQGPVVTGRATQGRRLALLALLALARGRPLSRDKLAALLWPEASHHRARPQLSDTLYILRHALGEEVVRSTGDGLVLNPETITSDVARFDEMVADGRLEDAVALYRGPLLDGFHIADSVEFETWLDGERAELGRRYARTVDALAEAAEARGDVDAALGWWQRRAAHEPHNGRVALRLMHAFEATGDRAGALQHLRIHAALLRDEFDAEPDAELVAFAERLRREQPPLPAAQSPALTTAPREPQPASHGQTSNDPTSNDPTAHEPASDAPSSHDPTPHDPARNEPGPHRSALPESAALHGSQPTSRPPARAAARTRIALVVTMALAVLVTLALVYQLTRSSTPPRSVGVLPFVNMSADPSNTYFSDGLSEQIILALSRVDGLRVAARTSSFALRHRAMDVRAIADTLDVQAVLEGSVLVDGERLRVIAQLIDARTGYHLWSEQYDGGVRDAFAFQDSIALAIAHALHLRLAAPGTRLAGARTPSLEAYDLYLRGLYLRNTLSADALTQAATYFDRVIELEPRFAQAWAAKASVIAPQAYFRYANRDSVVVQLRMLTARALELDPDMGEAHASLGVLRLFYEWDWTGAHAALLRAVELNPNDAHAWHHLGNYHSSLGQMEDALAARERAVQLDPLNARSRIVLSRDYLIAGDYDRALEQARRSAQLDALNPLMLGRGPGLPAGPADVLLRQGHERDAVEDYIRVASLRGATPAELQAMRDGHASARMTGFWKAWLAMDLRQSGASPDPVRMAVTHIVAGDTAQGLDWLDRAYEERNPALIYMYRDPVLSGMREHPRVMRISRAMHHPLSR